MPIFNTTAETVSMSFSSSDCFASVHGAVVFDRAAPVQNGVTLGAAIAATLAAKKSAGLRESYLRSLRQYMNLFARGRENVLLSSIRVETLERWFSERGGSSHCRASNYGRLSAVFNYAVRRGWLTENPTKRLERVRHEERAPQILSPEQAEQLLSVTRTKKPVALAYLALTMLAGVRPEETRGVKWTDIDLEQGTVRIDGAVCKTRRRRIIPLRKSAMEWLALAKVKGATLPVSTITRKRYVHHFRKVLNIPHWPQDVLRHTAASYWLAETQDAGKVARWLGNSAGVLLRYYTELVSKDVSERFWSIRPYQVT